MKQCNTCKESKKIEEFYKNRGSCIKCVQAKHAIYRKCNADKIKENADNMRDVRNAYKRKKHSENKEANNNKKREYRKENSEKIREQNRALHIKHKDKRNEASRKYYRENKEEILKYRSKYKKDNKERCLEMKIKNHKQRMLVDHEYALKSVVRANVNSYFKRKGVKKSKRCSKYGINFKEIYDHIGPRPAGHELDHIIPMALFDFNIEEHIRLAYSKENLRWATKKENNEKKAKLIDSLMTPELLDILGKIGKLHLLTSREELDIQEI